MKVMQNIRDAAMKKALKTMGGKAPKNIYAIPKEPKHERTLSIYADTPDVADKIQAALQELVNRSKPKDIKQFANAITTNPEYMELAVAFLPNIK